MHTGAVLEVVVRGDEVQRGDAETAVSPGTFHGYEDGSLPATANDGQLSFEVVEIEWR